MKVRGRRRRGVVVGGGRSIACGGAWVCVCVGLRGGAGVGSVGTGGIYRRAATLWNGRRRYEKVCVCTTTPRRARHTPHRAARSLLLCIVVFFVVVVVVPSRLGGGGGVGVHRAALRIEGVDRARALARQEDQEDPRRLGQ